MKFSGTEGYVGRADDPGRVQRSRWRLKAAFLSVLKAVEKVHCVPHLNLKSGADNPKIFEKFPKF